ncbi:MAG: T9SS type A sorting domain-containing protein, partial [Fimbriimonadaceae bacterium]|nr:T9SS type A sorting domain-containing protein [Chitinophagales bacterium]
MKNTYTLTFLFGIAIHIYSQETSGSWSFAYDMYQQRNGHTATYMTNGKILVTGGWDGSANTKTAEEYDPIEDAWTIVGEMDSIRFQHTATALDNGKVIIAGGWDGGSLNYIGTQIYDPDLQIFSDGPDMHVSRSGHTATKLDDGRVLFVGGFGNDGNTNIVELYDPSTDTIFIVDSLHYGRSYPCAVLLEDGKVLVAGGYNPDYGFQMSSVEIYDPVLNTWTDAASMNIARDYFRIAKFLYSEYGDYTDDVIVAGGRFFNGSFYEGLTSAETYNVESNIWTNTADIPEGESYIQLFPFYYGAAKIPNIGILLPGGVNESCSGVDLSFSTTYVYDFAFDEWISLPMYIDGRYFYAGAKGSWNIDTEIFISGGLDQTIEVFQSDLTGAILNQNQQTFSISPNPASTEINIKLNSNAIVKTYSIYNSTGAKIRAQNIIAQSQLYLSVADLIDGLYMVQLHFEDESTA